MFWKIGRIQIMAAQPESQKRADPTLGLQRAVMLLAKHLADKGEGERITQAISIGLDVIITRLSTGKYALLFARKSCHVEGKILTSLGYNVIFPGILNEKGLGCIIIEEDLKGMSIGQFVREHLAKYLVVREDHRWFFNPLPIMLPTPAAKPAPAPATAGQLVRAVAAGIGLNLVEVSPGPGSVFEDGLTLLPEFNFGDLPPLDGQLFDPDIGKSQVSRKNAP